MPDSNPGPLPQKSGVLPLSHHIKIWILFFNNKIKENLLARNGLKIYFIKLISLVFLEVILEFTFFQGWEFVHLLIAHLLISLKSNEQVWGIRSDRSKQMSDYEQIAQVVQRKWAIVRESLRSLKTNEWPWAIRSGCSEEMSKWEICSKNVG